MQPDSAADVTLDAMRSHGGTVVKETDTHEGHLQ